MALSSSQSKQQLHPQQGPLPPAIPSPARQIQHLPTSDAYNLWAEHYDSDGNFLQALDSAELKTLLPAFLDKVVAAKLATATVGLESQSLSLKIVDLGCGTGRNTLELVRLADKYGIKEVVGLDFSEGMLEVAKGRVEVILKELAGHAETRDDSKVNLPKVELAQFDLSTLEAFQQIKEVVKGADAVVSTLVLEHVPIEPYFKTCSAILPQAGAHLLVTNMHAEMGQISQAGFVDPKTGMKIRAESFTHEIGDVVDVAAKEGWTVEGDIGEKGVDSEDLVRVLGQRSWKWFESGVKTWFGMMFVKSRNDLKIS